MLQESSRLGFKSVLNDKMEKEIVAFLNNKQGGILYIGVNDLGHPVGVDDLDGTQLKIAERIQNNILPSTLGLFDVLVENIENVPVIKVIISSGTEKPYYIKKWYVTGRLLYKSRIIQSADDHSNDTRFIFQKGTCDPEEYSCPQAESKFCTAENIL